MTNRLDDAGVELAELAASRIKKGQWPWHAHVDLPFWNDRRIGVVEHSFGEDLLCSVDEFRSELYSSRFDERRLHL